MGTYYKFLTSENRGPYSDFNYADYLRGKKLPKVEDPVECERGYHACTRKDLMDWVKAVLVEVESDSPWKRGKGNKVYTAGPLRIVRVFDGWNETTQRLFAADCAERVLPIFEEECPGDDRPRKAIEAARAFARGEIDAAARDAASDAAWDAAWDAASVAAWAAAWDAASAAARDAAWAATRAATRAAARAAARKWQAKRLLEYAEGVRT